MMSRFKFPHIEEPSQRTRATRYFTSIFLCVFLFFGVAVSICAVVLTSQRLSQCQFTGRFYTGIYLLLAAGCITVFTSLLTGLYARRNMTNKNFVHVTIVLAVVVVLQFMSAIASHISYTMTDSGSLETEMKSEWEEYFSRDRRCVDEVQAQFHCCGVLAWKEWLSISEAAGSDQPYPKSCLCYFSSPSACVTAEDVYINLTVTTSVFHLGCLEKLAEDLQDTLLVSRVVGPVVAVVLLLLLGAVMYVIHHINNHSIVGAYIVSGETSARSPAGDAVSSVEGQISTPGNAGGPRLGEGDGERSATVARSDECDITRSGNGSEGDVNLGNGNIPKSNDSDDVRSGNGNKLYVRSGNENLSKCSDSDDGWGRLGEGDIERSGIAARSDECDITRSGNGNEHDVRSKTINIPQSIKGDDDLRLENGNISKSNDST